jgi:hypothetical protein
MDVCIVCIYSVFMLLCVAALRWADPPSKDPYRLCIGWGNWKSSQNPTKGCRAMIIITTKYCSDGLSRPKRRISNAVITIESQKTSSWRQMCSCSIWPSLRALVTSAVRLLAKTRSVPLLTHILNLLAECLIWNQTQPVRAGNLCHFYWVKYRTLPVSSTATGESAAVRSSDRPPRYSFVLIYD